MNRDETLQAMEPKHVAVVETSIHRAARKGQRIIALAHLVLDPVIFNPSFVYKSVSEPNFPTTGAYIHRYDKSLVLYRPFEQWTIKCHRYDTNNSIK